MTISEVIAAMDTKRTLTTQTRMFSLKM